MIKTFLTSGFIVASTLTLTNSAFAEISGQLAVGYEIGSYEVVTDIDIEADISMLTLSGSLFFENGVYTKLSHGTSEEDEWSFDGLTVPLGFDVDETTLTVGTMVDEIGIIAGYQSKTTEFVGVGEIDVSGVFLGLSKSYDAGDGALYFSGALAFMGADFSVVGEETIEADMAIGFSLGAGYNQAISENLVLSATVKYQSYTLDWNVNTDGEEEKEVFLRYGISLGYNF